MSGELEAVLKLVAEGRLTPEEAAPMVAALTERRPAARRAESTEPTVIPADERRGPWRQPRQLRIRVEERGRTVVNLRVPLSVAETALHMVPGSAGSRLRASVPPSRAAPSVRSSTSKTPTATPS